ncbi:MAG: hypothetical protein RIE32_07910 [Phycisphaerales bacterium]
MDVRKGIGAAIGAASLLLACGLACGQPVQDVARTVNNTEEFGFKPTDTGISVGEHAIVITSNHGVILYDKAGNRLDRRPLDDPANPFPFFRVADGTITPPEIAISRWFDPRSDYDPTHNRQWMTYSETNADPQTTNDDDISAFHVAVAKHPSEFPPLEPTLDTFDPTHWWYFTGRNDLDPTTPIGNAGAAFDMAFQNMKRYLDPPSATLEFHKPFPPTGTVFPPQRSALFDLPIIATDEQAMYVTAFGTDNDGSVSFAFQNIFIIPIEFNDGIPRSMRDGDRPGEGLITSLRLRDLPADPTVIEYEPDFHRRHYPVQEPFGQVDNCQLFVSVAIGEEAGEQDAVRLAGLWFDENAQPDPRWYYTQHIEDDSMTTQEYPLLDVGVGAGLEFFYANDNYEPETPDGSFNPRAGGAFISSAVLTKDTQGNDRVFVTHAVAPSDGASTPKPEDGYAVQWYVIDPNLSNFRVIQSPPVWNPQLVASGRIETNGTTTGDCLYPSIGVTRQGVAYIEYTFTSQQTWPQIRRVRLNSSYTAPVSNVLVQAGPVNYSYEDEATAPMGDPNDAWADFSDMQHDPFLCKFWSVHTLVHDPGVPSGTVDVGEQRDIWLFENRYTTFCFTPDMNGNGMVESEDATLYNNYYARQDERADADASGEVDVLDMAIFLDAFTAGVP